MIWGVADLNKDITPSSAQIQRAWCLECNLFKESPLVKGRFCKVTRNSEDELRVMSLSRTRHHTETPSWERFPQQHHRDDQCHHQQRTAARQVHRHVSDLSSDRARYFESKSSEYRARMDNNVTDYPGASRKLRNSKNEVVSDQQHFLRDHGSSQGSQGSQGSGQAVFRQKRSSSSSLDQSSYSAGDSRSSYNSFIREPVGSKLSDHGYFPVLMRGSGTQNSSQSDESHLDRPAMSRSSSSFHHPLPRSQSSQTTPLHQLKPGKVWPVEENDGGPYHAGTQQSRTLNQMDEYMTRQHMSPYYLPSQSPSSPISPISSSYSSEHEAPGPKLLVNSNKPWYEDDDPDIHSGLFFPRNSQLHRHSHHYEKIPYNGQDVPHNRYGNSSSPQLVPPTNGDDQQNLAQQRLDYYFSKQEDTRGQFVRSPDKRESTPAEIGRKTKYLSTMVEPMGERGKLSDSEVYKSREHMKENGHKKVKRVKSGGMGFTKLVKKIGSRRGRTKEDGSDFRFTATRSHSLEHLALKINNSDTNITKKGGTIAGSPAFTPKLSRQRHRQNSEPDLESALGLFRSGSKKNLFMDPTDALFEAIETQDYDACSSLLAEHQIDINCVNEDDWTPLDMAVMLNDQIALLLMEYGAKDSNKYFRDPDVRYHHVFDLLTRAEREKKALGEMSINSKEIEKQMNKWRNASQVLEKMLDNVQRASPPGPPRDVTLTVTSDRSLMVRFSEPETTSGAIATRYRIQWSKNEHFVPESGEFILCDNRREYTIPDLDKGERYYVRVFAFNLRGFGPHRIANPSYAIPSSWHDYANSKPRFQGCTDVMGGIALGMSRFLFEQQQLQQDAASTPGTPNNKRSLKKGITKFFSQGVKFCKTLKSGVYLVSLIYSEEGRIMVTVDECLPAIEISDSHPSSIGTDFAWLTKLSCTWENVRDMCETTEDHVTSPSIQFRHRLLRALAAMQIGTGQSNLGLVHHKTFQDSHGTTVFVTVQYIEDYKSITGNNKWSNFVKLLKKYPQLEEVFGHELTTTQKNEKLLAIEHLISDIPNIMDHHSHCYNTLAKGLYLGYLKARLSLASMTLVTSSTLPNVFPHYQIRSNPNISREEWAWIQSLASHDYETTISRVSSGTQVLQKTLLSAIEHFLEILGTPPEEVEGHQLYIDEVIELNEDVTFLLLMPAPENVCTPPGGRDQFDGQHFSHLPISTFELLQLYTYQRAFVCNFTMVSCRLDVELQILQKRMREALTKSETGALKKIKEKFDKYHEETENVWKQMRWIEIAVQTARNVSSESRLTIKQFREKMKVVKRVMSSSTLSSSISASLSSGGTLSPTRKSFPNIGSAVPSRYLYVYPGYDTGLAKGTTVKVHATATTTTLDVIRFSVNEIEKAERRKRYTNRELKEFYLAAVLGHHEDILPLDYTPLQLLNYSPKYKFIIRRFSLDQCTTEV